MMYLNWLKLYFSVHAKELKITYAIFLMLFLSACDELSTGEVAVASDGQAGLRLPQPVLRASVTAEGSMNAYLYCGLNAQAVDMTISGEFAQGSCTNLSPDSLHTIKVDFEFTTAQFPGTYLIASASREGVKASADGTDLSFTAVEFDMSFDDNNNQISNIDEINNGTNPGKLICIFGQTLIGQCAL